MCRIVHVTLLALTLSSCVRTPRFSRDDARADSSADSSVDLSADLRLDLTNKTLIFSDDFEGDLDAWKSVGGQWAIKSGELVQSDDEATGTFSYVHALAEKQNYRVVTRMRQLSGAQGGAIEINFRLSADLDKQYFCNWQPNDGYFLIMISGSNTPLRAFTVDLEKIADYDPLAPVTMELTAEGDLFTCRLLEIPDAHIVLTNSTHAAGVVGVKTYKMAAAFDAFRVYQHSSTE